MQVFCISVALFLTLSLSTSSGFPLTDEEEKLYESEFSRAGLHKLASWLVSQLRRNDEGIIKPLEVNFLPYRLPAMQQGKRNSELTNSMMGIPRDMIKNGRK